MGILRGNKRKTDDVASCTRQHHPPVSQELAWMRLILFYHKIASKSPSCPTLAKAPLSVAKVKELDFAYDLRCYLYVYRNTGVFSRGKESYCCGTLCP